MSAARPDQSGSPEGKSGDRGRDPLSWVHDIVPYGIFTTDRDLRITSWNDWLTTYSGLAAGAVLGRSLLEIYPDLGLRRLEERYFRALAGEISFLSVALHKYLLPFPNTVAESGLPHMLQSARVAPLPVDGKIAGTITIIEDVTQREFQAGVLGRQQGLDRLLSTALAALLQSDDPAAEMSGIFSSVKIALNLDFFVSYLVSDDGKKLQLHTSLGISPKQRDAISSLNLELPDYVRLTAMPPLTDLSIASHVEFLRQMGATGLSTFPLAVRDRVMGMVVFGSYQFPSIATADVSVLIRIARYVGIALDRSRRERDTVDASRAKDDFLAALSHELRTPLNPVLLVASDAMGNQAYPPEAREAFALIEKNALLEARLIDDLLDLTRISHGKLALDLQRVNVQDILRDAIQTVRADVNDTGLTVRADIEPVERNVLGDSGRLQQVFWNVLKNAVKFTPKGGQIRVTSRLDPDARTVVIQVSDTGIGMEPAELVRIFGAFSQGDHAQNGRSHRFGGLGLGLAISRKLVEMHSGRIEANSPGKGLGATFTISLPLLAPEVAAGIPVPSEQAPVEPFDSSAPFGIVRRILLVEDHEPTRATLARLLERRGFGVTAVGSAQSALESAGVEKFALVLSDIGLPDSDGFALMEKLRDKYGLRGIALTGYGMEEDLARSSDAGFFAHLTKPISVKILDRTLAQAFENDRA